MLYNYFRDYDPGIGRYMQSDPIGMSGGLNTFRYVGGHPLTALDDFGLQECTSIMCLSGPKRRQLADSRAGRAYVKLDNIHIEPPVEPPIPPTRIAGSVAPGYGSYEIGVCIFGRYRDIKEIYNIYQQSLCLDVCTLPCGKSYMTWRIYEQLVDTQETMRQEREGFVRNVMGRIVALECLNILKGLQ